MRGRPGGASWMSGAAAALGVSLAVVASPVSALASTFAVSEAALCEQTQLALVGKVVGRDYVGSDDPVIEVDTELTVEVESLLKGPASGTVTVVVPGGELDGRSIRVSGVLRGDVGERYVLLLTRLSEQSRRGERWVVRRWRQVPGGGAVPPSSVLGRVWREHCDPAFDTRKEGRPSAVFMQEAPPDFLEWCTHY